MSNPAQRVHFIGIGGSGMSGIAKIMATRGIEVSGSDIHDSATLESLRKLGIEIVIGHSEHLDPRIELVVRSSAIPQDDPEIRAAAALGIQVMERAEALASLMAGYRAVAVAGTHGKTTTTSMLTVALQHCGMDPSFVIGAPLRNSGTNAHQGSGDIFVVEADESDGSFVAYAPMAAVITNIELDHVDNFQDLASIEKIFDDFVATIGEAIILCLDDPGNLKLIERLKDSERTKAKILTYGTSGNPDLMIDRIHLGATRSTARFTYRGRVLGEISLSVPGRHNVLNAGAAFLMSTYLGAPALDVMAGLAIFTGARRRFEIKGEANSITVIDDYGHHPTELDATLATARNFNPSGRVIAIFQPHRFTRTRAFANEFAAALDAADHTFLLEIYPASEEPIPGVSSLLISSKMKSEVTYEPSMVETIKRVIEYVRPGDLILTLGAGDVSSLAPLILENLRER
jgi:UDP-N-acetylmuramate--alanine ligase